MSVAGFLHVALTVRDLDRSIAFYGGLLDFELQDRGVFDAPPAHRAKLFGSRSAVVELANLHGHGLALELFAFHAPRGRVAARAHEFRSFGIKHIAFHVVRFDRFVARLRRRRVPLQFAPILLGPRTGLRMVYISDPDRTTIELLGR